MNIFGFFAVVIACVAICIITMIVCKHGITIHHTHKDLTEQPAPVEKPAIGFTPDKKEDKTDINKNVEVTSMDAVIKAANELMGIETVEKENNNDRKE